MVDRKTVILLPTRLYASTHPNAWLYHFFQSQYIALFSYETNAIWLGCHPDLHLVLQTRYWNLSSILSLISRSSASFGGRVSLTFGNLDAAKNMPAAPSRKMK